MKRVKNVLLLSGLMLLMAAMAGCATSAQDKPSAPLATHGTSAPPKGCVALRQRGGSC